MKIRYDMGAKAAELGRTFCDNLVSRRHANKPLNGYAAFERIDRDEDSCSFTYMGNAAKVRVYDSNTLVIESDSAGQLRMAEGELKKICEDKGIPLVDGVRLW